VLDSLALHNLIRCRADRAKADRYIEESVIKKAAWLLRSHADDTLANVGLTTNATVDENPRSTP